MVRLGSTVVFISSNPIGNPLRGLTKLFDRPVGSVALRHVGWPGVVDQSLGQRAPAASVRARPL